MWVAPFLVAGALLLLLVYWFREKRAGRTVTLRSHFGNHRAEQPAGFEESSQVETDK